jgi:hypothetical protein
VGSNEIYDIYVCNNRLDQFELLATFQHYGIAEESYEDLKEQCANGMYEGIRLVDRNANQIVKGFWR